MGDGRSGLVAGGASEAGTGEFSSNCKGRQQISDMQLAEARANFCSNQLARKIIVNMLRCLAQDDDLVQSMARQSLQRTKA